MDALPVIIVLALGVVWLPTLLWLNLRIARRLRKPVEGSGGVVEFYVHSGFSTNKRLRFEADRVALVDATHRVLAESAAKNVECSVRYVILGMTSAEITFPGQRSFALYASDQALRRLG